MVVLCIFVLLSLYHISAIHDHFVSCNSFICFKFCCHDIYDQVTDALLAIKNIIKSNHICLSLFISCRD